jgi:hypothetical protein
MARVQSQEMRRISSAGRRMAVQDEYLDSMIMFLMEAKNVCRTCETYTNSSSWSEQPAR